MVKSFRTLLAFFLLFFSALSLADSVNINTADAKTIATVLDGIGPVKAEAIVNYRTTNGPFKTADELLKVPGIGAKLLEVNKDRITLSTSTDAAPKSN